MMSYCVCTTVVALLLVMDIISCKPFLDMNGNIANISKADQKADNRSSNEPGPLLASHQDIHPVLLPQEDQKAVGDASSVPIHQPIATDAEMAIALQKDAKPVQIELGSGVTLPSIFLNTTINHNATNLEALMDKIHQPLPDPNSSVIQPKGPEVSGSSSKQVVASARDLLPSIVGSTTGGDLGSKPVIGSGVPPAAIAQAKGELPKQMVQNPFGKTPLDIPVGIPPA